jgi:hypothetical protein
MPVRVATTTSGTLASSFENGDTIDGVTLATADRILIKNQVTTSENGVYTVNASGAPTRATDMDITDEFVGSVVYVWSGTANGNTVWHLQSGSPNYQFLQLSSGDDFFEASSVTNQVRFNSPTDTLFDSSDDAFLTINGAIDLWTNSADMTFSVNGQSGGGGQRFFFFGGNGIAFPTLTSDPAGGDSTDGQIYYNTSTDHFRGRVNGAWISLDETTGGIQFIIGGGGSAITTGIKGDIEMPFAGVITANRLFADQTGSIVIDLWKDTYANFPPVVGDSITASAKPTLSSASKSEDTTLTGWTTTFAAGDIIRVNVDSATTLTRVTLALRFRRT